MNHKNTDKTLIIEHLINRLFTLQLNQTLKRVNVGYLIHHVAQASRLHTNTFKEARLEILGKFSKIYRFYSQK